jgi:type II secretory pathway pseudopilin PulG
MSLNRKSKFHVILRKENKMKSNIKQSGKPRAFSIVELLTVMSIIVILFSLLMPALALARRYAKRVQQHAQFRSISAGLELFSKPASEGGYGELPDSGRYDDTGEAYCGAMKLAEAMVGQDLLGFNPESLFQADGLNPNLTSPDSVLYPDQYTTPPVPTTTSYPQWYIDNLKSRKLNLEVEGANVNTLQGIYGNLPNGFGDLGDPADPNGGIVLCDVYGRVKNIITGKRTGMPILYYKANVSRQMHVWQPGTNDLNIYNYDDNLDLVNLRLPFAPTYYHPITIGGQATQDGGTSDPAIFYKNMIRDKNVSVIPRPVRPDSYILISAGFDGEYGTDDDIFNFTQ